MTFPLLRNRSLSTRSFKRSVGISRLGSKTSPSLEIELGIEIDFFFVEIKINFKEREDFFSPPIV